jgi:transcriptional regulator with XRE-family HTH domain
MQKLISLRSLLFEKGITQTVLAQMTRIPRQYINYAIGGKRSLSEQEQRKIAETLGEPPERVFPELSRYD